MRHALPFRLAPVLTALLLATAAPAVAGPSPDSLGLIGWVDFKRLQQSFQITCAFTETTPNLAIKGKQRAA